MFETFRFFQVFFCCCCCCDNRQKHDKNCKRTHIRSERRATLRHHSGATSHFHTLLPARVNISVALDTLNYISRLWGEGKAAAAVEVHPEGKGDDAHVHLWKCSTLLHLEFSVFLTVKSATWRLNSMMQSHTKLAKPFLHTLSINYNALHHQLGVKCKWIGPTVSFWSRMPHEEEEVHRRTGEKLREGWDKIGDCQPDNVCPCNVTAGARKSFTPEDVHSSVARRGMRATVEPRSDGATLLQGWRAGNVPGSE